MNKLVIHKTVHGERFTFSSGHKVVGVNSINLVQAHKYSSGKTISSLEQSKQSSGVRHRRNFNSLNDAELKLEKSMADSNDTGIQAAGTGLKGIRTGNKVLWDTYRLSRMMFPGTGGVLLGNGKRMLSLGKKTVFISQGLGTGTINLESSTVTRIKKATSQKAKKRTSQHKPVLKKSPGVDVATVKKGIINAGRSVVRTGGNELTNMLSNSNDAGCQSVVVAKDFVKYGYRTINTASRAAYRAGAGNTVANVKKSSNQHAYAKQIKKSGYKKSSKAVYKKANKSATKKATKKAAKGIDKALSSIKKKLVFNPITLILLLVLLVFGSIVVVGGGTVAAVVPGGVIEKVSEVADGLKGIYEKVKGTISGVADWILGRDSEVDVSDLSIEEYLLGAVALYREDILNRIYESQQDYLDSDYHVIKINNLYGAEARAELSSVDREFIAGSVISTEDIVKIIMPLFNSIMLGTYGGKATANVINSLTEELNGMITDFEVSETSVEECDGHIDTCLNPSETLYHDSDSGLDCCVSSTGYCFASLDNCSNKQEAEVPVWETVDGELVQTGTVETEFCGGHPAFHCNGYTECLGHNVITFILGNKSIDELMQVYFLDRIDELNNKSSLTDGEINELRSLEQNYQFAIGLFEIYNE